MLRRLYDWTMDLAGHRHALAALAVVSFAESSFFPIPPDILIIPMVLAARHRAWLIATVCTVASVAGGLAGYAIGALLYDTLGQPIVSFYGYGAQYEQFQQDYEAWGAWIVAGAGFTPFPYKVITITSGVMNLDILVFLIASTISRGARFFILAALLWQFGPPIRGFIERHLPLLATLFFVLLFAGFVAIRYLF
ncbi:YqaA family protein [Pelagibius sp.]|uniref:YqaA family protein n=1 Tax=Pelagibius sp. TaxID=1931238 RepID=UPI003B50AE8D